MKRLSLLLLALLVALPASAQESSSRYKGVLKDFKKVQILCLTNGSGDYLLANLCATAENEARSAARAADLDVEAGYNPNRDDAFTVYVSIAATRSFPQAVSVRVEASREYAAAVDSKAGGRDPSAYPRKGRLVMFEDYLIASGSGDTLDFQLRRGLRQIIRTLFLGVKRGE